MNKEDIKKINNRISFLQKEFETNNEKIKALLTENNRIQGAVQELALVLENLSPHKKGEKQNGTP